ncbi:MAG: hypothetical protein PGN13_03025 [Patulibacter minatonensis]
MTSITSAEPIPRYGWLEALRAASEAPAGSGAVDAAVAVERGGELVIVASVAGTFAERSICPRHYPESFLQSLPGARRWLSVPALEHLGLPADAHVLVVPSRTAGWRGATLLRYDERPPLG